MDHNPVRWHVAATSPQCEAAAKTRLERQGFRVMSPLKWECRVDHHIIGRRAVSIFTGYLLVRFNRLDAGWRAIVNTRGIAGMLPRHNEIPSPVKIGFVERMIEASDDQGVLPNDFFGIDDDALYHEGDILRFLDGAMFDRTGTVETCIDRTVVLRVDCFGREIPVETTIDKVEPIFRGCGSHVATAGKRGRLSASRRSPG